LTYWENKGMSQRDPYRPSVVWTRRGIVLAVLGGLIWGIVALVSAAFGFINGLIHPNQPTLVAGGDCQPQVIRVDANVGTAKSKYQGAFNPADYPNFWFTVTNTGPVSCKFNVGSKVTYFWITSGSDNVWNSKDCKVTNARVDYTVMLDPSVPVTSPPDYWEKVRSSGDGCTIGDGQPVVAANGATYMLHASVNGVISSNDVPFVLN
jgi:hypothetical protein